MAELDRNPDEPPPDGDAPPPPSAETTSDRGQRLVPVPPEARRPRGRPKGSKNKPVTEEFRSLDDVVRRHIDREPPVHTPDAEVPPGEPDPARRMNMTMGPISLTPDAYDPEMPLPPGVEGPKYEVPDLSDGLLRTLEDLLARFDFDGSGQFYIMVTRQRPTHVNGILTQGRMRDITIPMTHEEFGEYYGGGQYQLIVYGPPARGQLVDPFTGRPKPKALSKPISVIVPYQGPGAREPNPLAALEFASAGAGAGMPQATDLQSALINRRTNTLADAKMLETATQKDLIMDERQRAERKEEIRERRAQEQTAVSVVKETKDEQIQMLRDQLEDAREEARQKNGHGGGAEVAHAMASLVSSMQAPRASEDELGRMKQSYEERIRNLTETHTARIRDIDERHKRELEDRERVMGREKEDAVRRADDQARIATQQLQSREQALTADRDREREDARKERERAHADHQRDTELLKKEHERDLTRQKEHYENILLIERNTNARDRETLKESLGTKGELLKATVESELRTANNEVTRLRAENERLKTDLDKKSNLPKQIEEFERAAEAMGLSRDDGKSEQELDWKATLLRSGATALEKLPEIIENAGKVVAMTRGAQQAPPPVARPPGGLPPLQPPRALPAAPPPHAYPVTHVPPMWATEDSAPPSMPPAEFQPGGLPPVQQQPTTPAPAPPPAPPVLQPTSMPPAAVPASAPPPRPAPLRRARPPAEAHPNPVTRPVAPPPAPAAPVVEVSDEDIIRFAPLLETWFADTKTSPEQYAEGALGMDPNIRLVAPGLTPEAVAAALQRNGRGLSPLVRRDGQRFLRRFRDFILGAPP